MSDPKEKYDDLWNAVSSESKSTKFRKKLATGETNSVTCSGNSHNQELRIAGTNKRQTDVDPEGSVAKKTRTESDVEHVDVSSGDAGYITDGKISGTCIRSGSTTAAATVDYLQESMPNLHLDEKQCVEGMNPASSESESSKLKNDLPTGVTLPILCTQESIQEPISIRWTEREAIEKIICRFCRKNQKNIVYQPCGHMIACASCGENRTECDYCEKHIETTVKVFM